MAHNAGGARRPPQRVAVAGRPGCGRRTVTRAMNAAGIAVVGPDQQPDVEVYVLAEALKPEDRAALTPAPLPRLAVLAKADLTGFGGRGPMAAATRRCARMAESIEVPMLPLAALAAVAALDGTAVDEAAWSALDVLTAEPANLGSVDGFAAGAHPVSREIRARLLAALDLFGVALAVRALRDGADRAGVRAVWRQASGIDEVLAEITRLSATAGYRRLSDATAADRLGEDAVVFARMAAAVAVVEADGMRVDRAVTEDELLRRAVAWQRYARGPVSRLHRACGDDIVRGSLRLWEHAGGVPEPLEPNGRRRRARP